MIKTERKDEEEKKMGNWVRQESGEEWTVETLLTPPF